MRSRRHPRPRQGGWLNTVTPARAVEVLHDHGAGAKPRWTVGSGFLIGKKLVLTAAHTVGAGALTVRLAGSEEHSATIKLQGSQQDVDLAVLSITDDFDGPELMVRYAFVDRSSSALVDNCWAVGFPRYMEQQTEGKPLRESVHIHGTIAPGSKLVSGMLQLEVTASPRLIPPGSLAESDWQGISGAVVFARHPTAGDVAVGVIVEHHRPEGQSSLTVVPITALSKLAPQVRATWWGLFNVPEPGVLLRLPAEVGRTAHNASTTAEAFLDLISTRRAFFGGDRRLLLEAAELSRAAQLCVTCSGTSMRAGLS
jgi:Trypsin-like peptidase domain